ncbi:MAG TPA: dTDP-4-dehydrorhamnose reductase [Casimicrobiaceae bacterium]|nr:dTDP-4-dehydrorhamnose reductase [Casimicrobiaceae bacterium]
MTRPTILVTGAAGQLGYELARVLPQHGDVAALDRLRLDLADADAIRTTVRALRPQLIVNAGAYTAVDQAERESALAEAINARAPGVLAEEAQRLGAVLIHYSTDYVFDGLASTPYAEESPTLPLNVYGRSKLHGEQAIAASAAAAIVFRTSWVYASRGRNFFLTIRRLAAERDELRIVADQWGIPNWSRTLAEATATLVGHGVPALAAHAGLYHLAGRGQTNWFEFARAIVGEVGRPTITPIETAEYPTAARRPAYAVLATGKFERTFGFGLPDWREMLRSCIAQTA